jgi:hypothetical protein
MDFILEQSDLFQDILNSDSHKNQLQSDLVSELTSNNISSAYFEEYTQSNENVCKLYLEKDSFLSVIFMQPKRMEFALHYFDHE